MKKKIKIKINDKQLKDVCLVYADLVTRVCPRPEFEKTGLYIQREIFNVNVTGRLVGGRWLPRHQAVVVHYGFRVQFQLVVTVSAVKA